jgi:hypothetical protein
MKQKPITLTHLGCYFGLFMILFGAVFGYAFQDYRHDQWVELTRSINMCSADELGHLLHSGAINRDDFPDALFLCIEADLPNGVENLLALGARTNVRNAGGLDPWEYAGKLRRADIILLMLQSASNPHSQVPGINTTIPP